MSKQQTSTEPVIFKEIEKTPTKMIRIWRNIYKGRELLSIQNFWREDEADNWQFGKAITFDYEDIDNIIDALEGMKQWCGENPGND